MKQQLLSATLRLTGWYLLILAIISLLFSVIVYQISTNEIEHRLARYQDRSLPFMRPAPPTTLDSFRSSELAESKASVVGMLLYVNVVVLTVGGGASYLLARRTLRPIEEAHSAQARFVSDTSHELRTPLATMTTELEVALQDTSLSKQEMRDLLGSNLEEVQRLSKLSSMLLMLSSDSTTPLPRQTFSLYTSVQQAIERTQQAERITLHAPKKTVYVHANQQAIEELVLILLDNALKYSPPDSSVTIALAQTGHRLHVRIINGGDGIAPEHMPHIFDRFYRADSARTGSNGYGLGLALAKQISDSHGAGLTATSIHGGTTVFSFSLPIFRKYKAKTQK